MKFAAYLLTAIMIGAVSGQAIGADNSTSAEGAPEEFVWFNGDNDQTSASLIFGSRESAEDISVAFTCTRGSGTIRLFVAETGETLKPGQKVSVTLTAGTGKVDAEGEVVPNEMAGGTSSNVDLPASAPVFATMTEAAGTLEIAVADAEISLPLKGIGTKATDLAAVCRK